MKNQFMFLLLSLLVITNSFAEEDSGETSGKELRVKKNRVTAIKINGEWHEGSVLSATDTSIMFSMNIVVYKKIDSVDAEGLTKSRYEAMTVDTPMSKVTNISFYKTENVKSRKRRKVLMWVVSIGSVALAPLTGPVALIPVVATGFFISAKYINPVKRVSLKKKRLVLE